MNITLAKNYGASVLHTSMGAKICKLEKDLLKMPQAEIKTSHVFLPGIYERTISIPAWTVLTGAIHKTDYKVRLESGSIAVNTDDGMKILTAPCEFDAKAGMKRVGRVLSDAVIWTDIYPNPDNCKDLTKIEARLYELDDCELGENRTLRLTQEDRNDYQLFLAESGLSAEQVWEVASSESDLIPMPAGFDIEVRNSNIDGQGLFAMRQFSAGETICPGRIGGMRTPAGRFINHSLRANATTIKGNNGDLSAMATRRICPNEEILIDYRNSMRVNFGIEMQGEKR